MEFEYDSDECPPLTEVDIEFWTDCLNGYLDVWLQNSPQFFEDEKLKMVQMALCPFLYGVTCNLPKAWLEMLINYGVIDRHRVNKTSPLRESELEMLEMAELIFKRCSQLVSNKNDLKTILNFIYEVEEKAFQQGHVELNYAVQFAGDLQVFISMCNPLKRTFDTKNNEKKKKQIQVCIIYFFKTIHHHVVHYGRDGVDKTEQCKQLVADFNRSRRCTSGERRRAKEYHDARKFDQAQSIYTRIIETDPFSHLSILNRAQTYLELGNYWGALSDCKRAILLDPSVAKTYYRAAKAYLNVVSDKKFQLLEKAKEMNQLALDSCVNEDLRYIENIKIQTEEIREALSKMKSKWNNVRDATSIGEVDGEVSIQKLLHEGSSAYQSKEFGRAVNVFGHVLDKLSQCQSEGLAMKDDDLTVLNFVYGKSCVESASYENIQSAIDKFSALTDKAKPFLPAYYGLALAYKEINRYKEALISLEKGMTLMAQSGNNKSSFWPETKQVIEETDYKILMEMMKKLLNECNHPPRPDVICRCQQCVDNCERGIYLTDPEYKGHVQVCCREKCIIEYHITCWKVHKQEMATKHQIADRLADKAVLDLPCPTPDCCGLITALYIYKPEFETPHEMLSSSSPPARSPRPHLKTKKSNQDKINRKEEKKRVRKERRLESKRLAQTQIIEELEETQLSRKIPFVQGELGQAGNNITREATLLVKEDSEVLLQAKQQKTTKSKKKEKKQKNILTFDLQFKGDEDKERFGADMADESEDKAGILPTPATNGYHLPGQSQNYEQVANGLIEFFESYLKSAGPTNIHSVTIANIIEGLQPVQRQVLRISSGLPNFLNKYPNKFSVQWQPNGDVVASAVLRGQQEPSRFQWEKRLLDIDNDMSRLGHPSGFPLLPPPATFAKPYIPAQAPRINPGSQSTAGALGSEGQADEIDDGFVLVKPKRSGSALSTANGSKHTAAAPGRIESQLPGPAFSTNGPSQPQASVSQAARIQDNKSHDTVEENKMQKWSNLNKPLLNMQSTPSAFSKPATSTTEIKVAESLSSVSGAHSTSPSLSTQSQGSSSDSHATAPKPLRAPGISMPTRGKKKGGPLSVSSLPRSASTQGKSIENEEGASLPSTTSDQDLGEETCSQPSFKDTFSYSDSSRQVNESLKLGATAASQPQSRAVKSEPVVENGIQMNNVPSSSMLNRPSPSVYQAKPHLLYPAMGNIWSTASNDETPSWPVAHSGLSFPQGSSQLTQSQQTSRQPTQSRVLSRLSNQNGQDQTGFANTSYPLPTDARVPSQQPSVAVTNSYNQQVPGNQNQAGGYGMNGVHQSTTSGLSNPPSQPWGGPTSFVFSHQGYGTMWQSVWGDSSGLTNTSKTEKPMLADKSTMTELTLQDIEESRVEINRLRQVLRESGERHEATVKELNQELKNAKEEVEKAEIRVDCADTLVKGYEEQAAVLKTLHQTAERAKKQKDQERQMRMRAEKEKINLQMEVHLKKLELKRQEAFFKKQKVAGNIKRTEKETGSVSRIEERLYHDILLYIQECENCMKISMGFYDQQIINLEKGKPVVGPPDCLFPRQPMPNIRLTVNSPVSSGAGSSAQSNVDETVCQCTSSVDGESRPKPASNNAADTTESGSEESGSSEDDGDSGSDDGSESGSDDDHECDDDCDCSYEEDSEKGEEETEEATKGETVKEAPHTPPQTPTRTSLVESPGIVVKGAAGTSSSHNPTVDSITPEVQNDISQNRLPPKAGITSTPTSTGKRPPVNLNTRLSNEFPPPSAGARGSPMARPSPMTLMMKGRLPKPKAAHMTSFEKIMANTIERFPNYGRHEIQNIIQDLREEHGGSLRDLSGDALLAEVIEKIVIKESWTQATPVQPVRHTVDQGVPGLQCSICQDALSAESRLLDCGHKFHDECIRSWLTIDRTCPICRKLVLLAEEYPSLR